MFPLPWSVCIFGSSKTQEVGKTNPSKNFALKPYLKCEVETETAAKTSAFQKCSDILKSRLVSRKVEFVFKKNFNRKFILAAFFKCFQSQVGCACSTSQTD